MNEKNILNFDYFKVNFNYYILNKIIVFTHYIEVFLRFKKTFQNYRFVLMNMRQNNFPIVGILKTNEQIKIKNIFHASIISKKLDNLFHVCDDHLEINIDDKPTLKLFGWENNGDKMGVFFEKQYEKLPVTDHEVIDIGANIGDSSLFFAIHNAKKIYAVEPHPEAIKIAKYNIRENNMENVIELIHAGVSEKSGTIKINESSKSECGYSLKNDLDGICVPLVSVKNLIERCNSNKIILKMDCEGCEYPAILSTSSDILKQFNYIQMEFHNGYVNLKEKLEMCGFKVFINNLKKYKDSITNDDLFVGNLFAINKN